VGACGTADVGGLIASFSTLLLLLCAASCWLQVVFVDFFRAPFLRFAAINSLDQVRLRVFLHT
jgi:hypothetical protein